MPADRCDGLTGSKHVQCRADARALDKRCGGPSPRKTAECTAYAAREEESAESVAKGKASRADEKKEKAEAKKTAAKTKGRSAERYWVQVAGGRNKGDLPKAWAKLKAKSPALLGRRAVYTAPTGSTNRLLVGPFDTRDDARDLINKLKAAGLSTFPWTSQAGEDVDKLAAK